jgi:hypothetical protein
MQARILAVAQLGQLMQRVLPFHDLRTRYRLANTSARSRPHYMPMLAIVHRLFGKVYDIRQFGAALHLHPQKVVGQIVDGNCVFGQLLFHVLPFNVILHSAERPKIEESLLIKHSILVLLHHKSITVDM